jgi:hypothetical protein
MSGFRTNKIQQCQRGRPTDPSVSDSDDSERSRPDTKTATIENGFVWLPEAAPWLAADLAEFAAFPAAATTTRSIQQPRRRPGRKLHLSQSIIGLIRTAITAIRLCNGARRAPLLAYPVPCELSARVIAASERSLRLTGAIEEFGHVASGTSAGIAPRN